MSSKKIIEIKDLHKSFGSKKVLKGINLDVQEHECLAIVGENGAGKTTLIEIVCQSQKQDFGQINYYFKTKNPKDNIGVQFQEGVWPSGLKPIDMIKFYSGIYPDVSQERIKELIKTFELTEFLKRPLNRLSGGQKQRFNAFLAVFHKAELIIFDEITTGLDIELQYKILNYLKSIVNAKKQTIILVSHGPGEIEMLADRIVILHNGKIFYNDTTKAILSTHNSVRNFMDLYFNKKIKSNIK